MPPPSDGQKVFGAPHVLFRFSLFTLALLAFLTIMSTGVGIGMFMTGHPLGGPFFLALGGFFIVLLRQVARNTRGPGVWRLVPDETALHLAPPGGRAAPARRPEPAH